MLFEFLRCISIFQCSCKKRFTAFSFEDRNTVLQSKVLRVSKRADLVKSNAGELEICLSHGHQFVFQSDLAHAKHYFSRCSDMKTVYQTLLSDTVISGYRGRLSSVMKQSKTHTKFSTTRVNVRARLGRKNVKLIHLMKAKHERRWSSSISPQIGPKV